MNPPSKTTNTHSFNTYTFPSVQEPETIAAYSWTVPNPCGVVFLLHGFRSHTRYNFLRNDTPDRLHQYGDEHSGAKYPSVPKEDTSFIRELNVRNLSVFGHDHVGHGSSTGLRSYFTSFSMLVEDLVKHVKLKEFDYDLTTNKIPVFLCAHSMGGTTAISAAIQNPSLFAGLALSSAATEPPENMFGLIGTIQYLLSGITSVLIPTTIVVNMPKNDDESQQKLYESDPLNSTIGVRSRVGRELIAAYDDIALSAESLSVPFFTASGQNDTLVNPKAAERFCERASSTDKKYLQAAGRWHNLFTEDGCENIWKDFADWVEERALSVHQNRELAH